MSPFFLSYKSTLSSTNSVFFENSYVFFESTLFSFYLGLFFFFLGFFFKLSLFPCYVWAPDVYDGSHLLVVAFMVIAVKFVIFCVFLRVLVVYNLLDFFDLSNEKTMLNGKNFFFVLFTLVGFMSIVVGSLGAISQEKIKRFVAFTSINQMGLMFLGLVFDGDAVGTLFNLFVYCTTSLVVFSVFLSFRKVSTNKPVIYMNELHNFFYSSPSLIFFFTLAVLSVSGIPPFLGFFSKYLIFLSVLSYNFFFGILILLFHVIGMFNYLRLLRDLWFVDKNNIVLYYPFMSKGNYNIIRFLSYFQVIPVFFCIPQIVDLCFLIRSSSYFEMYSNFLYI